MFQTRRLLLTRNWLLEGKAAARVDQVLTDFRYQGLTRLWSIYQAMIAAYDNPKKRSGRAKLAGVIDALNSEVTRAIPGLRSLARTLKRRRNDILAFSTHPYTATAQPKPSTAD